MFIGFDIGSSSVKAALVDPISRKIVGTAAWPEQEMPIVSAQPGWAEQHPEQWWKACQMATQKVLAQTHTAAARISAVGIAYQMHGLVLVDAAGEVLRPAIIWCDSRAVSIGEDAFQALGADYCMAHYLNSPGNFTASKLKWVRDHEPAIFERARYLMLPGDYIAYRMTGEALTTVSGLSEGILWDFLEQKPAERLLQHLGIGVDLLPPVVDTFGRQGRLTAAAADFLGLPVGIPVGYRAGDQPNNAWSLRALHPGEVAATGGTSGVVYGIIDRPAGDVQNRVNSFAHVNHRADAPRIGVLLCINGAGSMYRWLRHEVAGVETNYATMEQLASAAPEGSDGVRIVPFGNGSERMLGHRPTAAQISGLDFNRHQRAHLFRAGLEGIAFAFVYGMGVMEEMGLDLSVIRAGNDNLFQSPVFSRTIAQLTGSRIELWPVTGAAGAALGAGVGSGYWSGMEEGIAGMEPTAVYPPMAAGSALQTAWEEWRGLLDIS